MLKGRLCEAGLLKLRLGNRFRRQRLLKTQQQGLGSLWLKTLVEVVVRMHVDLQMNFIVSPGSDRLTTSRTCIRLLCVFLQMLQKQFWRCKASATFTCHSSWKNRGQRHHTPVRTLILWLLPLSFRLYDWKILLQRSTVHSGHCPFYLAFPTMSHHVVLTIKCLSTENAIKDGVHLRGKLRFCPQNIMDLSVLVLCRHRSMWPEPTESQMPP